jgi:deoxyribodipyrimidine photo-lyase
MTRAVLWFRRDLRLAANDALAVAAADGEVVPLFVIDPAFATAGAARQAFMSDALSGLDASMGGALVFRHGNPADVVPQFAAEVQASSVVVAADFGPYGTIRDRTVEQRLVADGRALRRVGSPYAVDPGTIRKDDGAPYAVFTPFSRRWKACLDIPEASTRAEILDVQWYGAPTVRRDGPPPRPDPTSSLPPASEAAAAELLDGFVGGSGLDQYAERRDLPGVEGTSRLSAYLRWGILHPEQVLARLATSPSHEVFRNELCWREFYADVLARQPESAWHNLQGSMNAMPVDTDQRARERFAAWTTGTTGYPIVDAGMRQLLATGWMHNRVRMWRASW